MKKTMKKTIGARAGAATLAVICAAGLTIGTEASAGSAADSAPEYPPLEAVTDGLTKVVPSGGGSSLYDLYADKETGRLMAVLASNYASQDLLIACTVSGGDPDAGVMGPTIYGKWRKLGKQLALVSPNYSVRTSGGKQAQDSVSSLYTDQLILSVPIASMAPGGRPVIDFSAMAMGQARKFFGTFSDTDFGPGLRTLNPRLATITKAKSFPKNFIVEYEAPQADGRFMRVTYAFGELAGSPGFQPRKADPRVGYFYNWHVDYSKNVGQELAERYINRWNIEKADASLKMSPPKQPIVWYIEHTTPVKYRRYVRDGILMWNKAFEKVGILDALEVYQQDSATGAHMDKDPEDARYNFFRWNTSNSGYAIGPSRSNPMTGEILDADVVWHQGLTRAVKSMLATLTEQMAEETFSADALAWYEDNPEWDPRVRMATPARRAQILRERELQAQVAVELELDDEDHPWTHGLNNRTNTACQLGNRLSMDISLAGAAFAASILKVEQDEEGDVLLLDGVPEEFLGAMIRYISAHEVGHCLGLQHNMAASSIRSLEEINSEGFEGPSIGSVMDYAAVNINCELGDVQGPYATREVGPYDHWAIAYGYGPASELEEVLARVSEPDHIYLSQAAISVGSDPRNMTWDLGANNLNFSESRLKLVRKLRASLLDEIVEDGESWAMARRRFNSLAQTHMSSLFSAAAWIGGSYENYDFKGDPGDRSPIEDVPSAEQRRALKLIIDNTFKDDAFNLTPELVRHLGKEYWWDAEGVSELMEDPNYTIHDLVGGFQAVGMSLILNPTTLRRVYDNEFRTAGDDDVFTMAEVLETVTDAVWTECEESGSGRYTAAKPMCSSFRRNLQQEHVGRLIDLALLDGATSPSLRTISSLATQELNKIAKKSSKAAEADLDPYTSAHLASVSARISKAMEAVYVLDQ